jgi:hypothetical protein
MASPTDSCDWPRCNGSPRSSRPRCSSRSKPPPARPIWRSSYPAGEDLAVFLAQVRRVGTPSIDPALRHPLTADDDRTDDFVVALAQWNRALLVTGDSRLL